MRIGIVNDLPTAVEALRRAVTFKPEHCVIWVAQDGAEAVNLCAKETPDLVLMDLVMPRMDGVEATRRIMAATPCAILIVTVSRGANYARVFEAMGYGALDVVDTPQLGCGDAFTNAAPLLAKIDTIRKLIGDTNVRSGPSARNGDGARASQRGALVGIGSSAGGPPALATLLSALPHNFPAAIVIVQHLDEHFTAGMAEWLNRQSLLQVLVATEGDRPRPGVVLLSGTNEHLTLLSPDRLGYTRHPMDYVYRPSVDVFFHSVGRLWLGEAVGVLLTGMGRDGAVGLKALRDKGCHTIAQDQTSSAVYGMPKAAAELHAAIDILALEHIAPRLVELVAGSR
jgi:two-component system response regulator WspF